VAGPLRLPRRGAVGEGSAGVFAAAAVRGVRQAGRGHPHHVSPLRPVRSRQEMLLASTPSLYRGAPRVAGAATPRGGEVIFAARFACPERCTGDILPMRRRLTSQQARLVSIPFCGVSPTNEKGRALVFGVHFLCAGLWRSADRRLGARKCRRTTQRRVVWHEQNCREARRRRPSPTGMVILPAGNEGLEPRKWNPRGETSRTKYADFRKYPVILGHGSGNTRPKGRNYL
jgi:hypothetical protein